MEVLPPTYDWSMKDPKEKRLFHQSLRFGIGVRRRPQRTGSYIRRSSTRVPGDDSPVQKSDPSAVVVPLDLLTSGVCKEKYCPTIKLHTLHLVGGFSN